MFLKRLISCQFFSNIFRNLIVQFNYAEHYMEIYGDWLADLTLPQ